jgi:hypothetical protein
MPHDLYCQLSITLDTDPAFLRLCQRVRRDIGCDDNVAFHVARGGLLSLWLWLMQRGARDGVLRDADPDLLAQVCRYTGDPDKLWDALEALAWLVPAEGGGWYARGWGRYQAMYQRRDDKAEQERNRRAALRDAAADAEARRRANADRMRAKRQASKVAAPAKPRSKRGFASRPQPVASSAGVDSVRASDCTTGARAVHSACTPNAEKADLMQNSGSDGVDGTCRYKIKILDQDLKKNHQSAPAHVPVTDESPAPAEDGGDWFTAKVAELAAKQRGWQSEHGQAADAAVDDLACAPPEQPKPDPHRVVHPKPAGKAPQDLAATPTAAELKAWCGTARVSWGCNVATQMEPALALRATWAEWEAARVLVNKMRASGERTTRGNLGYGIRLVATARDQKAKQARTQAATYVPHEYAAELDRLGAEVLGAYPTQDLVLLLHRGNVSVARLEAAASSAGSWEALGRQMLGGQAPRRAVRATVAPQAPAAEQAQALVRELVGKVGSL